MLIIFIIRSYFRNIFLIYEVGGINMKKKPAQHQSDLCRLLLISKFSVRTRAKLMAVF